MIIKIIVYLYPEMLNWIEFLYIFSCLSHEILFDRETGQLEIQDGVCRLFVVFKNIERRPPFLPCIFLLCDDYSIYVLLLLLFSFSQITDFQFIYRVNYYCFVLFIHTEWDKWSEMMEKGKKEVWGGGKRNESRKKQSLYLYVCTLNRNYYIRYLIEKFFIYFLFFFLRCFLLTL